MSSILKALKKLEQDKALRRPDTFRIDADILRSATPRRSSTLVSVAAVVAIFACGAAATYLYLQPAGPPSIGKAPRDAKIGDTAGPAATTVLPVGADPAADRSSDRTAREPAPLPVKATPVPDKSPSPPRPPVRPPQALRADPDTTAARIAPTVPQPFSQPAPPAPVSAVAAPVKPPILKVHGIAFQDGADSVAVINGVTVTKGSMIEDVRVEEILKDRVRFSRGGEKFEIVLEKSN